jgi:hypothetical protein
MNEVRPGLLRRHQVAPAGDKLKALRVRDDFRNGLHELLAPDVFPVEVAHSLTRAER